jgi:peptide/nickel transport system substrate-binding protein
MATRKLTRRAFLAQTAVLTAGVVAAGCGATPTPAPTATARVVEVTKVVTQQVPVTQIVEKQVTQVVEKIVQVTPTAVPPPVKKSGPLFIGTSGMTGKHLIPIWLTSQPQFLSIPLVLPALTWFNDQVQPIPHLAEKIDVSPDATVYTFTLPAKAAWSDGTPLTAKDVVFTYKLAMHPAIVQSGWTTYLAGIKGMADYVKDPTKEVAGLEAVNDQTVRITLSAPNAAFLHNTFLGILPSHILSKVAPADIEKSPYVDAPTVTSGPYDFVKFEPGQYIQLKKKASYWGKVAQIDEIFVKMFESTATMLAQLEAGEIQVAPQVSPDEVERFRKMQHMDILPVKGIGYYVLHFDFRVKDQMAQLSKPKDQGGDGYNVTKEPKPYLQDKRFRQAIAYALDIPGIIKVVANGEGVAIQSSIFGPDWALNPNLNKYTRDLAKSKALMQEAGVTFNTAGTALWQNKPIILTYLSNTSEEARKLGEALQQQLAQAGVRVDIKLVTSAAFLTTAIETEGDLIRNAGGRFGAEPNTTAAYYTCSAGWARLVIGYCNKAFDDLMAKGVATSVIAERQKIYYEASKILNEDLPSLFLFTNNVFYGVNKGVKGVKPPADPGYTTWNITEWTY